MDSRHQQQQQQQQSVGTTNGNSLLPIGHSLLLASFLCLSSVGVVIVVQSQSQSQFMAPDHQLSLCSAFPPARASFQQQQRLSATGRHFRGSSPPPNVSRSQALLLRPGTSAKLSLFGGGGGQQQNGTPAEATVWGLDSPGEIRCSLRLDSCPECLIGIRWPQIVQQHFTEFQIQSLANCESRGAADGADLVLARSEDHRPCFSLHLVEERADRPLPPNMELEPRAMFDPAFVYRRMSIWDDAAGGQQFNSTGNSLLLVAGLRHVGQDFQLGRWLRQLFPLEITILDGNTRILVEQSQQDVAAAAALPSAAPSISSISSSLSSFSSSLAPSNGSFTSPRYPFAYPRSIRQNIQIESDQSSPNALIRLWFDDFHLHFQSDFKVLDSDGRELFNWRKEDRRPSPLVSRGPRMSIQFQAREFTEPIGFRANYQLTTEEFWAEKPTARNCDEHLDGFGGRISLDGQRHLLGEWLDCIWLIGRLSAGPPSQFDHLYLRVDQFQLRGQQMRLELREGGHSTGRLLFQLDGEQTPKQLVQKQPEEGFVLAAGADGEVPTFYLRLRGRLEGLSGLSVLYALFYRWPTALCPGGSDEFHCDNGKCIRASLRCDGFDHCGDSSDELCHFPTGAGGRAMDGEDQRVLWPSSPLAIAFGLLSLFLLLLLLVLFASRSARRHLVASPLGRQLCSLQSAAAGGRRRETTHQQQTHNHHNPQQQQRSRGTFGAQRPSSCGQQQRANNSSSSSAGAAGRQRQQQQAAAHSAAAAAAGGGANRRNSSSLATQLDFAVLNNLLGSAAGVNLGPSIQTLGERRFFVLPANQAPISLIEAPPTYADALKHPKVTPRGGGGANRRAVHPSDGQQQQQQMGPPSRRGSVESAPAGAYQNRAFRLSPAELLRMEAEREEEEGETEEQEQCECIGQRQADEDNQLPESLARPDRPSNSGPSSPIELGVEEEPVTIESDSDNNGSGTSRAGDEEEEHSSRRRGRAGEEVPNGEEEGRRTSPSALCPPFSAVQLLQATEDQPASTSSAREQDEQGHSAAEGKVVATGKDGSQSAREQQKGVKTMRPLTMRERDRGRRSTVAGLPPSDAI